MLSALKADHQPYWSRPAWLES